MLQSRNISNLLQQALKPCALSRTNPSCVSLLTPTGQPLISCRSERCENMEMLSLLAITAWNHYESSTDPESREDWLIINVGDSVLVIKTVAGVDLFLLLIIDIYYPKAIAQKRLENMSSFLSQNLAGFKLW